MIRHLKNLFRARRRGSIVRSVRAEGAQLMAEMSVSAAVQHLSSEQLSPHGRKAVNRLRTEIARLETRDSDLRAWLHEQMDATLLTREEAVYEEVLEWIENHD